MPARLAACRLAGSPQARLYPELVRRLWAPWDDGRPGGATADDLAGWDVFWAQSWYLCGPVGRGKSGLAAAYAWQWVDPALGDPSAVVWYSVPRLLGMMQDAYEGRHARLPANSQSRREHPSAGEILERCREADLLVLDDMGAEYDSGSGWVGDKLYQIVAGRHEAKQPTFFTSNYDPLDLQKSVGDRIIWRVVEMCGRPNIVLLDGPNLREAGL